MLHFFLLSSWADTVDHLLSTEGRSLNQRYEYCKWTRLQINDVYNVRNLKGNIFLET
jgi:hypothetical protein